MNLMDTFVCLLEFRIKANIILVHEMVFHEVSLSENGGGKNCL